MTGNLKAQDIDGEQHGYEPSDYDFHHHHLGAFDYCCDFQQVSMNVGILFGVLSATRSLNT